MDRYVQRNADFLIDAALKGYELGGRGILWYMSDTKVDYIPLASMKPMDDETKEQVRTYDPCLHFVLAYPGSDGRSIVATMSIERILKWKAKQQ